MSEDKRRLRRRHIRSYMAVHSGSDQKLIGQLVDITQQGILVISEDPVPVGSQDTLVIRLSSLLDGEAEIRFEARCVRCEADINPRYTAVGFEIAAISRSNRKLIELLIKKYGLRDLVETGELRMNEPGDF